MCENQLEDDKHALTELGSYLWCDDSYQGDP